jgi:hypothetical protein
MTLPTYGDGCIIPNIRLRHFLVYFAPKCEHAKLRGAHIGLDAETANDAIEYARKWIRLAQLTPVSVTEVAAEQNMHPFAITEASI